MCPKKGHKNICLTFVKEVFSRLLSFILLFHLDLHGQFLGQLKLVWYGCVASSLIIIYFIAGREWTLSCKLWVLELIQLRLVGYQLLVTKLFKKSCRFRSHTGKKNYYLQASPASYWPDSSCWRHWQHQCSWPFVWRTTAAQSARQSPLQHPRHRNPAKNYLESERERGQWDIYYASPLSFKIMFSYLLACQLWGL